MIGAVENNMEQGERARSFRGEVKNALLIAIFTEKLALKQNLEGRVGNVGTGREAFPAE